MIDLHKIEEMAKILVKVEEQIKETIESLHLINNSIDKYDKYSFLNVSKMDYN
ncbi:DegQ family regulator [uncultured Metabacillus sp.]|uniref:DegQ family regulator n=1 Tax=uncultured Metabacillus sp. TaxID=2860135 RepID=UPI00261F5090|nr:DegQ family regulator [uncultured Metabacillus sp.]